MMVVPSDKDRAPRSVINLTQVNTFLTLVEEGSIARASARLGLGHSTVSAHSKLVAEEFGHNQFSRIQGGLVVSQAGLEAYGRLRAVLARAVFCIRYFREARATPPRYVSVRIPTGFPGSALDGAFNRLGRDLALTIPDICLLPHYADTAQSEDRVVFRYGSMRPDLDAVVRDRWVVVRAGANIGWNAGALAVEALADTRIQVPRLPGGLHASLTALSERAHAMLEWSGIGLHELLARAAQLQNFCALVPASLVNLSMVADHFECALLEQSELDPGITVATEAFPDLAEQLRCILGQLLGIEALSVAATAAPAVEAEPETLSLKHCRSFLALYEEGNVRRAAQRLSIVQPALTVQLHRIEEQAGCSLFTRSYHGLRANGRADALYALIQPLIAEFNATLRHLRAAVEPVSAPVRVGLIPALDDESLMAEGFAAALDKWSRGYPDTVVQVVEGYSNTLVRWLNSGRIDLALIDRVFQDPDLTFEPIAEDSMAVVVDAASGLLRPGPVSLEQLVQLPLVLPSIRHGLRTLMAQTLREHGLPLQPRLEVDSMAGCLSLVKIARYATILPMGSVYKSRDRRRLSVHEIREPRIVRNMCLARLRSKHCSEPTLQLIEELRLAFADAVDLSIDPVGIRPVPAMRISRAG